MEYVIGYFLIGILVIAGVLYSEYKDGENLRLGDLPIVIMLIAIWPLAILVIVDLDAVIIPGKKRE